MKKRANRLYELRKCKKASQIAVALKINISQSVVSKYENSDVIPSDLLILFANFYNVSIDYILMRTDDKRGVYTPDLTVYEQNLLSFYRNLETEYKKLFEGIVSAFQNSIDG